MPTRDAVTHQMIAIQEQKPQRELAIILKRLKNNVQQTLNELHNHMHYNSEHQHNNPITKHDFPYNVMEMIIRYGTCHKDINWLRAKQDRDQRVIINLEALQPILTDPSTHQELVHIINDVQKNQQAIAKTLDNHNKWNEVLFYGLPAAIFWATYRNSHQDRLASAIGCSAIFGPIFYYLFKHKDIRWLNSDAQERQVTIGDLQKLAAMLPKTNTQQPSDNN